MKKIYSILLIYLLILTGCSNADDIDKPLADALTNKETGFSMMEEKTSNYTTEGIITDNASTDGTKEMYNTNTSYSYDTSGYSATDDELLAESNQLSAANMAYSNEVLALVNQI